ncbi:DNA-3-methyladenine glycosylase [Thermonema lapsum]|uniref:Putative 3-methyladenine DNA glycosylase n=1 Tax=Thermonema lapsum TaxID=28195 RepID=A0A846MPW9_9BACT|nr:DNA-3-methyladenine glycosylase [Thermonema lapsum]NIK73636.1 DNA-3-methyladenine glycosylase [Thermonema lapsum]
MILDRDFYERVDVVEIARELIGKVIVSEIEGCRTAVVITEAEAYCGATDRACHAFGNRRTPRTEVMFGAGGHAYVYLCYGIHRLFNVVTNQKEKADAVLIRAGLPLEGVEHMLRRRKHQRLTPRLIAGPGTLTQALGINLHHNAHDLTAGRLLWLEDRGIVPPSRALEATPRIGIDYAGEDALLPWRFVWKGLLPDAFL